MSDSPRGRSRRKVRSSRRSKSSAAYWRRYRRVMPRYFWDEEHRLASIIVACAKGSELFDVDGKSYIDLTSQWGTNNLGNVPPEVLAATVDALGQYGFLIYFMNPHVPMIELAEKLLEVRPSPDLRRVLLELSGTGAAEAAVKYAVESTRRPLILSFMGQYHGLSIGTGVIGTLSAQECRYWEAFQGGAVHAPYPFSLRRPRGMSEAEYGGWVLDYIEERILKHIAAPERIAGVIFEPIALEAGTWIPPSGFAEKLEKLCHAHGWVFIDDEVESGLGRTGRMWAIEHSRARPDLMAIGKGLSGGLMPIAAVMGSDSLLGEHEVAAGTTFGGHPAACVAASVTLDIMRRDRLPQRSARLGARALKRIQEWERFDAVGDTRGWGLSLAVELVKDSRSMEPDPQLARRVFFDCVKHGTI
ncbi:MAG: aminotransferase class III-fold pyridoxal phosphate-dependent enzyme, partial [Thermoplasmata archaeon]